jgi:hypothetical protein
MSKPLIELSSHAFSVVIGTLIALAVSSIAVPDFRPSVPGLLGASFVALVVYGLLQLALAAAEGVFDKLVQSHRAIELAVCFAGIAVTVAAFQDLSVELKKADKHKKECAAEVERPSASASAPAVVQSGASHPH